MSESQQVITNHVMYRKLEQSAIKISIKTYLNIDVAQCTRRLHYHTCASASTIVYLIFLVIFFIPAISSSSPTTLAITTAPLDLKQNNPPSVRSSTVEKLQNQLEKARLILLIISNLN